MEPSPSPEQRITRTDAELLLDIAESTIATTLQGRRPALPRLGALPESLHEHVGAFVTLTVADELNGCIGNVEGTEPLGHAVARLAFSAAFGDPRLPALRAVEFADLNIELSLLSPLLPIDARSRPELLDVLRPFHDGLVMRARSHSALFLPTVWTRCPDPDDFLDHLWLKAGLQPRTWPTGMQALRFTTERHDRNISRRSDGHLSADDSRTRPNQLQG
jgi:uncharacterized protein